MAHDDGKLIPLSDLPPCAGGMSRRNFCAGAGVGLIALGLPACDAGDPRIGTGAIDSAGGGVGGGGGRDGGGNPDMASGGGGGNPDMTSGGGGNPDLSSGGGGNPDLATPVQCKTGLLNAGAASSYTVNTAKSVGSANNPILVAKDANGFYAMTAICPHQGCTVKPQSTKLYCPCHSGYFDMNGGPISGPVSQLDHYAVCVDSAGNVWVDDNTLVAKTTRA